MQEIKFAVDSMERRGTFVGTMNYLAPEMVINNSASMATDIWALGCIIFKLITGNVPFTGTIGPMVFEKIVKKDIDFPEYLSVEAVALIDSLLMLNPAERLGSPGSSCGIQNLKNHPFFKGIDFSHPKSLCLSDYHRSLITGSSSSTAQDLIDTSNAAKNIPRRSAFNPSELAFVPLVCKGFLLKKNRWFNKQIRYFQLYANGELKYYKDIRKYKGKITLAKNTNVVKTGKNQMEIPLNNKSYILLELDHKDKMDPANADPDGEESKDHMMFTNELDRWISAIETVVKGL